MQETRETWAWSLGQEDPLEKEMTTHSSILLGKSHGQRSLVGYSPWSHHESDTIEQLITYYYLPAWGYNYKNEILKKVNQNWNQ